MTIKMIYKKSDWGRIFWQPKRRTLRQVITDWFANRRLNKWLESDDGHQKLEKMKDDIWRKDKTNDLTALPDFGIV